MFQLLRSLFFVCVFAFTPFVFGHDEADDAHALQEIYKQMVVHLNRLEINETSSDVGTFEVKGELYPFRRSAFAGFVAEVIRAKEIGDHIECKHHGHCEATIGPVSWKERLEKFFKEETVHVAGAVHKGLIQYGLTYVAFFVVFEIVEHSAFVWMPPMCPVYHAAFKSISDFCRKFGSIYARHTEVPFLERAQNVFKSVYLDVSLWQESRNIALKNEGVTVSKRHYTSMLNQKKKSGGLSLASQINEKEDIFARTAFWKEAWLNFRDHQSSRSAPRKLEDDLKFIFSSADSRTRYAVAMELADGFSMMADFLSTLVDSKVGEISTVQYLKTKSMLGRLGRAITYYRESLRIFSLADGAEKLEAPRARLTVETQSLINISTRAAALLKEDVSGYSDQLEDLDRRLSDHLAFHEWATRAKRYLVPKLNDLKCVLLLQKK